jgi:transposase-like protein
MNQERIVRRRVRRSADEKQELLSAWEASGLSAREFAKREDVRTSCLWRWRRAAAAEASKVSKAEPKSHSAITFAPVHIMKARTKVEHGSERVIAELVLSSDVRVRVLAGADMVQVALLARALAGGVGC